MRKIYAGLAALLVAATIVQFYLAAVGAFTTPQTDDSYALHSLNGMAVIPVLSVLVTIAAALARAPGRDIAHGLAPFGLVLVQVLIIVVARAFNDSAGNSTSLGLAIAGLHAVNGMLVIGAAVDVFRKARRLATAPAREPVAEPV